MTNPLKTLARIDAYLRRLESNRKYHVLHTGISLPPDAEDFVAHRYKPTMTLADLLQDYGDMREKAAREDERTRLMEAMVRVANDAK